MANEIWISWSSGKDSAWMLYTLLRNADVQVTGLIVTINQTRGRVAMHGTLHQLLDEQVKRLGIPLYPIYIPEPCDKTIYHQAMEEVVREAQCMKVQQIAFGDLFLEEIRAYREKQLQPIGIKPIFPLWGQNTQQLAHELIDTGFKAIITCVDTAQLPADFVGRIFDKDFLQDLPEGVDPCGENGEFHSFVYDGPLFDTPIPIKVHGRHHAGQFIFSDVRSVSEEQLENCF